MGLGGTGGDDYSVELVLFDGLGDLLLGILGAGEEVLIHVLDKGEVLRIVSNLGDIHDPGDIGAALAYEYPYSRTLAPDLSRGISGGSSFTFERVNRASESRAPALAAAAEASVTEEGMSLGEWKQPATKMPGREA